MTETATQRAAPARTSKLIVLVIVAAALGSLAWYTGLYRLTGAAILGGVVLGVAVLAGARGTTPWIGLSSVLFTGSVILISVAAVLAALAPENPFNLTVYPSHAWPFAYLVGVGTAACGATAMLRQDLTTAGTRSLIVTTGVICAMTGVTLVTALVAAPILLEPVTRLAAQLGRLIAPSSGANAFPTLILLVGLSSVTSAVLINWLPIPALVERERRAEIRDRVARLYRRLLYFGGGATVLGILLTVIIPSVWRSLVQSLPEPAVAGISAVATIAPLRIALLALSSLALVLLSFILLLRRLRTESLRWLLRLSAHGTGGGILLAAVFIRGPSDSIGILYTIYGRYDAETERQVLADLVAQYGTLAMAVGIVTAACFAVALFVHLGGLLGYLGVIPARTAGVIFAASGLIGAAIVTGELVSQSVLLFAIVGAAIVVWDVGTYGQRLRLELHRGSRRLEILHAGTILIVAGCSVSLVYGLLLLTETLDPRGTAAAAVAALAGVLLITAAARG